MVNDWYSKFPSLITNLIFYFGLVEADYRIIAQVFGRGYKTCVTLVEGLFLNYDWDRVIRLEQLHHYYYKTGSIRDIKDMQIDNKTVINLLQFLNGALFDYPLLRFIHLRVMFYNFWYHFTD